MTKGRKEDHQGDLKGQKGDPMREDRVNGASSWNLEREGESHADLRRQPAECHHEILGRRA